MVRSTHGMKNAISVMGQLIRRVSMIEVTVNVCNGYVREPIVNATTAKYKQGLLWLYDKNGKPIRSYKSYVSYRIIEPKEVQR